MNNQNEKNSNSVKQNTARKIIIGLLTLCLIGGLTIYAINRAIQNASLTELSYEHDADGSMEPDVSVPANIPVKDSLEGADTSEKSSESGKDKAQTSSAGIMPVQGEITKAYSGDSLVYSETLDQYICHKAIDISAAAGSPVCAVMAGTITEVGKNDRYGPFVEITHGNGLESRYCCLGETGVSEGDVVSKGDKIGVVGEEALFEKAEGPHLHFEVLKDGTLINPDEITK